MDTLRQALVGMVLACGGIVPTWVKAAPSPYSVPQQYFPQLQITVVASRFTCGFTALPSQLCATSPQVPVRGQSSRAGITEPTHEAHRQRLPFVIDRVPSLMTGGRVWVVVPVIQLFLHLALFLGRLRGVLRRGGRDAQNSTGYLRSHPRRDDNRRNHGRNNRLPRWSPYGPGPQTAALPEGRYEQRPQGHRGAVRFGVLCRQGDCAGESQHRRSRTGRTDDHSDAAWPVRTSRPGIVVPNGPTFQLPNIFPQFPFSPQTPSSQVPGQPPR